MDPLPTQDLPLPPLLAIRPIVRMKMQHLLGKVLGFPTDKRNFYMERSERRSQSCIGGIQVSMFCLDVRMLDQGEECKFGQGRVY